MAFSERKSLRPPAQRASFAPSAVQRLKPSTNDKSKRASIATSSPSKSTYAQKTQSSNSRMSDVQMEETNISVYVRCRQRNAREIKENSGVVVETKGHNGRELVLQTGPMSASSKTYTFDGVFGAESDQEMVYDGIAKGVLHEMLQGYNCTVFAYGQTGTGKTYTMSGDIAMSGTRLSDDSGIIPRILVDLFKSLENNPEFSIKISFIELYNEELRDLLLKDPTEAEEVKAEEAKPESRKVKIFEDPNKKTIVVQGMEEIYIKSAIEGLKVLAEGSYRRQVAATKCNDLSSRSHSVFTITVHMKEVDPISGEEYLKIGKLNLVDLAGSENISRSGAENKRAREAGMINQSLLTLGRVINALVEKSPHIPYRESKLTRLLQDSLGGKTKTCIIATISPAKVSLEETISTLEYANRAKSIKNKPQVNQTMSKKMLIKEYVEEIERLRNDLAAARSGSGFHITAERYEEITAESESRRILVDEQKLQMNSYEYKLQKLKAELDEQSRKLNEVDLIMNAMKQEKKTLEKDLEAAKDKIYEVQCNLRLEELVTDNCRNVTEDMTVIHGSLVKTLQDVVFARDEIHNLLDKKKELEAENLNILGTSKVSIINQTNSISQDVNRLSHDNSILGKDLDENFKVMVETQKSKIQKKCKDIDSFGEKLDQQIQSSITKITDKMNKMTAGIKGIESVKREIIDVVIQSLESLKETSRNSTSEIISKLGEVQREVTTMHKAFDEDTQNTLKTVQEQIGAQTDEILSLSDKLIQYQKRYNQQLEQEAQRLEILKVQEKEKSEKGRDILIQQISTLISDYDYSRTQRLNHEVDAITPAVRAVGDKQAVFAKKFEEFVREGWLATQTKFKDQLMGQADLIHSRLQTASDEITTKQFHKILKDLESREKTRLESITNAASALDSKMSSVDQFAKRLISLNSENHDFTQSQLLDISSQTQRSFNAVTDTFVKIGSALSEAKPQLVDSHLQKQEQFIDSFKDATLANISNLQSYVSSIQYNEDGSMVPKRQKVTIQTDLPRTMARDEILQLHRDQVYPPRSHDENIDKRFKQPLSEIRTNTEFVQGDNVSEKLQKPRTHAAPSSSSSRSIHE